MKQYNFKNFKKVLWPMCFLLLTNIGCQNEDNSIDSTEDTLAPTVSSTIPGNSDNDVAINRSVVAIFSESMDASTLTDLTFTVVGSESINGEVVVDESTLIATFTPTNDLDINTSYTATLTTVIEDASGNELENEYVWVFVTGATTDLTSPSVASTNPEDLNDDVVVNHNVVATFSESIDVNTCSNESFTLKQGTTSIEGVVTCVAMTATFNPDEDLDLNTEYTATLTTEVIDLAGNALATDFVWQFTTGEIVAEGPDTVNLSTASTFAILSKSGVTDVPTSIITGDVGSSPISGSAILVTCDEVTGTIYAVDAAGPAPCSVVSPVGLNTNIGDMTIAYTDAAGRTLPDETELGAGEMGGLTITPGLYKWGTDVLISTDVTLSGAENDIWIFQIAGTLVEANGIQVILSGGAQAKNVFWQVGGDNSGVGVSIGTTAQFEGTVLALKGIALNTGAIVNGRLLSQTAVTLQSNTVVGQ